MLIRVKRTTDCREHQVTEEKVFLERRQILKQMGFLGVGALLSS